MSNEYPRDLRYTKEHEWARVDGGKALVGITRYAVDQLGWSRTVSQAVSGFSDTSHGEPGGIRTHDQGIKSPLLYR